jgi:hypothetical protein
MACLSQPRATSRELSLPRCCGRGRKVGHAALAICE